MFGQAFDNDKTLPCATRCGRPCSLREGFNCTLLCNGLLGWIYHPDGAFYGEMRLR